MGSAITFGVAKKLEAKEADAMTYAVALQITDNDTYSQADQFCVGLKGLEKEIIADFEESKSAADTAHKAICAQEKYHLQKIVPARTLVKNKMSAYQDDQERRRRIEEDRQRIEAQKAADAEALRQAEQAQAEGKPEEAEAILQAPVYVAPIVVPKDIPKTSTVIRKIWTFRIIASELIPRQYLIVDESALRKQAAATGNTLAVPGVEFYQKTI